MWTSLCYSILVRLSCGFISANIYITKIVCAHEIITICCNDRIFSKLVCCLHIIFFVSPCNEAHRICNKKILFIEVSISTLLDFTVIYFLGMVLLSWHGQYCFTHYRSLPLSDVILPTTTCTRKYSTSRPGDSVLIRKSFGQC